MNLRILRWIDTYVGIPLAYLMFLFKKILKRGSLNGANGLYRRILLVKFWGTGNIFMLLPAALALKEECPEAEFDFLTLFNNKEVLETLKIFNRLYFINTNNLLKFIITTLSNLKILWNRNYDLIVDFEQFARFSALFCSFIGRKKTIGFNTRRQHRHFLYAESVKYNNDVHITKSFCSLAETAGIKHIDIFKKTVSPYDSFNIEQIFNALGIYERDIIVVMHMGTSRNFILRRWPREHYAQLSDRLIDVFSAKIIFTGVRDENFLVKKTINGMKNRELAVNVSGRLNFGQFMALIKRSDLVVSADTAPIHIASYLSVPAAGLYGPNTPVLYGPWGRNSIYFYKGLDCSPCITNYNSKINKCRHAKGQGWCMREISIEDVFSEIKNSYFNENAKFRLEKLKRNEEIIKISTKNNSQ